MQMIKKYIITNSILSGIAILGNAFFLFVMIDLMNSGDDPLGIALSMFLILLFWILFQMYNVATIIFSLATIKKNYITSIVFASINLLMAIATLVLIVI